jgi:peptidoglycan/xylan/chitin deacetylase (PgdA/CDA1 family)
VSPAPAAGETVASPGYRDPVTNPRRRVAILMYHSIAGTSTPEMRELTVSPERFDEQIGALRDAGVRFVHADEVLGILRGQDGGDPGAPVAAVTIDDAFADCVDAAAILARHGATATVFVPTAYVGTRAAWLDGEDALRPIASWEALAALHDAGIEVAAHGHWHIAADLNPAAVVEEDARRCRGELEDHLGASVRSYAYPFGFQNRAGRRAIAAAGFASACAIVHLCAGPTDDPFALPRLHVGPGTAGAALASMVTAQRSPLIEHGLRGKDRLFHAGRRVRPLGPRTSQPIGPAGLEQYGRARYAAAADEPPR